MSTDSVVPEDVSGYPPKNHVDDPSNEGTDGGEARKKGRVRQARAVVRNFEKTEEKCKTRKTSSYTNEVRTGSGLQDKLWIVRDENFPSPEILYQCTFRSKEKKMEGTGLWSLKQAGELVTDAGVRTGVTKCTKANPVCSDVGIEEVGRLPRGDETKIRTEALQRRRRRDLRTSQSL